MDYLHSFGLIFHGTHVVSFTFDILELGPNSLLNNTCGARCVMAHTFFSNFLR